MADRPVAAILSAILTAVLALLGRPGASWAEAPPSRPCPAGAVGSIRSFASFARCPNARAREGIKKTYENQISRQPFAGADTPTRGGYGEPNKT